LKITPCLAGRQAWLTFLATRGPFLSRKRHVFLPRLPARQECHECHECTRMAARDFNCHTFLFVSIRAIRGLLFWPLVALFLSRKRHVFLLRLPAGQAGMSRMLRMHTNGRKQL